MTGEHEQRDALGGYVLGGLSSEEEAAVAAHLDTCAACREELASIDDAPVLLELARTPGPEIPRRVRDRVVADAARRRSRRRWTGVVAAAATVAAIVGGVAGWALAPAGTEEVTVPLQAVAPFEAEGRATFQPEGDRVRVRLELEGLDPLEDPGVYEAWLYTHGSRIVSIGQLTPDGDTFTGELVATGALAEYRSFWLTAEPDARDPAHEGETVVRAPVPELR